MALGEIGIRLHTELASVTQSVTLASVSWVLTPCLEGIKEMQVKGSRRHRVSRYLTLTESPWVGNAVTVNRRPKQRRLRVSDLDF
jgi:hypothetical protein